jgi:hypothetical protein
MKKQTKKQTAAKPRQTKPNVESKAKPAKKSTTPPKAKPKQSKPVVATTLPPKAKPVASPPTVAKPPVAESVKPVMAALPPPFSTVGKPDQSESAIAGKTGQTVTVNSVSAVLIADITELLEELIDTASPKLASTISRLAYVLCEVIPGLQAVSKRADITLCRKCGVTFGWDRQAEAERAVRSGKYQKSIAVS